MYLDHMATTNPEFWLYKSTDITVYSTKMSSQFAALFMQQKNQEKKIIDPEFRIGC